MSESWKEIYERESALAAAAGYELAGEDYPKLVAAQMASDNTFPVPLSRAERRAHERKLARLNAAEARKARRQ